MVSLQRKLYLPRIQMGSNIFPGGGGGWSNFSREVQILFSIETIYVVIFQGGGGDGVRTSGSAHVLIWSQTDSPPQSLVCFDAVR